MIFKYVAYSTDKKLVEGKIDVADESLAETTLYRAGFENIISLEEVAPRASIEKLLPSLFGIKSREIIDTTNQLATLIQSGITLSSALKLLEGQTTKKALKKVLSRLLEEIQSGSSLSQALTLYPQVFPNTYCQTIKASEQAGNLDAGLKQAAIYLDKQSHANQKIIRAMTYPAFVLLMAIGVAVLLVVVALPPLTDFFASLHAELPWTTNLLINISHFLSSYGLILLAVIGMIILSIIFSLRYPSIKLARDKFLLGLPVIGKIIVERSMGMFCQTASMLLRAGLRLPQVFDIVIQTNRNQVIRSSLVKVRERLIQGEGLWQPMSEDKLFPPLLVEMAMVGEKTGTMDATLGTLADFYTQEVDRKIDSLIGMIEPALTLVIGLVVIFIALSMVTPLYSILHSVK
jgi:type IV pilus assembly protein PilC